MKTKAEKTTPFETIYLIPPYKSTYAHISIQLTAELFDEASGSTYHEKFTCEQDAEDHLFFVACHYSVYGGSFDDETHISDCATPEQAVVLAKALGAQEPNPNHTIPADHRFIGFSLEDWAETHYEIVTRIYESDDSEIVKKAKSNGVGGCWQLSIDLTNQFQKRWDDRYGDEDWYELLELFLERTFDPPTLESFNVTRSFDSLAEALAYCHQYDQPERKIEELAQYNIGTGEYGFARELLGYFK